MMDEVALIFGGAVGVAEEYKAAKELCTSLGLTTRVFVCNSAIGEFPEHIDFGVTLHPESLHKWTSLRDVRGYPKVTNIWAHRPEKNITRYTRDWGGSCSLMAVKAARMEGFKKIILCGCPMTVQAKHFLRGVDWNPALAFRRGWNSHKREIPPQCVRSMSGWTKEQFGAPDAEWLQSTLDVPTFKAKPLYLKA